ncbi:MAG: 6-bladed beta-propeller [Aromatoleum sp.]|uniref:6-bladed beta-propeller n=1 Tax=Aromatoleum sp. TaxID=2307007 RepID=UPI002894E582|nr:6-bladed beta-propeller [Aromatoleum sp.]MDT3670037.1 6-bladed beta-propeller [Aromatoleum sp.]
MKLPIPPLFRHASCRPSVSRAQFAKRALALCAGLALLGGCAQLPDDLAASDKPAAPLVFPAPPDEPRFVYERTFTNSTDVVADNKDDAFRRMVTGAQRGGHFMTKPYAVAAHRGRVFVSDSAERSVKVFDVPGGKFFTIGEEEPGMLIKPLGLDVDRAGRLYVADATQKTVFIYDRDGKFLRKIGGTDLFDRISSVTVDPSGRQIYVVDIGGVKSENHRVRVFETATGRHVMDIGKRGNGPGEFNLPRDMAIGKEGRLYVVDGGNFRVQVFNADGSYRESFGAVGRQLGNFARPKEIATDADGNVYVADAAFGNFQIFTADGELLMYVGSRSEQGGPARYILPSGIAVDEDGRVFFVDQWFAKVDVFRPYELAVDQGFLVPRTTAAAAK